ncbi:YbaB/EbfC family nucleoid-associated protein [Nocardia macrotermitis]|uniref:YbaB/EbfC DNA-binding family protein n=1 Tax=Nocardia macrotermitis TaxID=2585198 RepID=A0A7K0DB08_9NOCA|nr:YbaB/EbfC family nucleoid-associated protein [Nocardia macrotermitis]MQY22492.1 hypothetical protein [Nocardia macrotermitis]
MPTDETDQQLDRFEDRLEQIARLKAERTQLTGTGTAERRRVTVTVNADGIAIDIKFSTDITDLDYDEIATAITEASRKAVTDVADKTTALFAPIAVDPSKRAGVGEALQGIAELGQQLR